MKKLLIAGVALTALIGTQAMAADMAAPVYKAPPPVAPVYSWTGFYIGVNAGWKGIEGAGMTSTPNDAATLGFNAACIAAGACPQNYGNASGSGFIGGGQVGYNWQVQSFLLGVETDFQGTSAKASITDTTAVAGFVPFVGTQSTKEKWLGTVRARVGVLATPTFLAYVTGGFAYAGIDRTWSGSFAAPAFSSWSGSDSSIATGGTVGAGAEWAAGNGWSVGVEYLYARLHDGNSFLTTNQVPACVADCTFRISSSNFNDNIVRAKLNFKFH
jgi:outer membrane immunogenic protein